MALQTMPRPTFILGAQRSGTTMLGECLAKHPHLIHYPEGSHAAYEDYRLRPATTIGALIDAAPADTQAVVFKPLTESHRAADLLEIGSGARAIWLYRDYEDRARSAVTKFGGHNLDLVKAFARREELDIWQAGGLDASGLAIIDRYAADDLNELEGACLFWYLRNRLAFSQSSDLTGRTLLLNYERLTSAPENELARLSRFLEIDHAPEMAEGVHRNSVNRVRGNDIRSEIHTLCESLLSELLTLEGAWAIR